MINATIDNSPVRQVKGKVELYEGSTLLNTFTYRDKLISFTVERVGEDNKFFGFGICQKINIKLIDTDRELDITTAHHFKAYLTTGEDYINPYPRFYVSEVHRDENTNELSITAYDVLYGAKDVVYNPDAYSEFVESITPEGEEVVYTLETYANIAALHINLGMRTINLGGFPAPDFPIAYVNIPSDNNPFKLVYPTTPNKTVNLQGTETVREVLDDIAEVTQTVYYLEIINGQQALMFKRLDRDGEAKLTISKADYFTLDSKTNRRLVSIVSTNELADDAPASLEETGTTQYVRDNAFWDLREERQELVDNALAAIGGITINQFDCSWRGNFLLELGDKIALVTKDNKTVYSYLLNDVVEYNGSLSQKSKWQFTDEEEGAGATPNTLGEAIKKTYAKVNKAEGRIDLVVESVADLEKSTGDSIEELSKQVALTMTTDEIEAKFSTMKTEGVEQVITSEKKFTFNDEGLNIADSGSVITTHIDEDGMTISRAGEEVLIANNEGVRAEDLHATTYLIIGDNTRFEDYEAADGEARTGCFWIGGI